MPTPEKEYYQKKLIAGTGITISPSNVISAVTTGSYMNSTNPAGIGRLSMNRYQPSEFSTTISYSEGDYVSYEGVTYVATTAVAAGNDFDSSQWDIIMLEGAYSNTLGYDNIAMGGYQTVRGKYNEPSYSYVDIVGWGTDDTNRANIQTLDSAGNLWVAGRVSASPPISSSDLVTKQWAESTFVDEISGSGLAEPTAAQGQNGYSYAKYHLDVSTSAVVVDSLYQKINGEWAEIHVGGGGSTITVDNALSTTSTNPVENRVITTHVQGLESTVADLEEQMENIGDAIGDVLEALEIINGSQMPELNEIADDINGEEV